MADEIKTKLSQKSAVIVLLVFVVFAAAFLILDKSGRWHEAPINQIKSQPPVDLVKLKLDYVNNLRATLTDYLDSAATVDLTSADFMDKTKQASQKVLALVVPAEYKNTHLSATLDLAQIEQSNGNLGQIQAKLELLKELVSGLK